MVRKDGLLNRKENTGLGWSCAGIVVVMNMAFHYKDYGSSSSFINTGEHYHCWLDYQTGNHLHHWLLVIIICPMVLIFINMNTFLIIFMMFILGLLYGQMLPLLLLTLLTIVLIEASGAATDMVLFPRLKDSNDDQVQLLLFPLCSLFIVFIRSPLPSSPSAPCW